MEDVVTSMGAGSAMAAANLLSMDASQFGNDPSYEFLWATKTYKYAEVHFQLISSFDAKRLRLTKFDDQIYRRFKRFFKNFKVDVVDEEALKSEQAKARWRPFCEHFKGKIEDYNFGTLLRMDCSKGYSEDNTILVTRVQFFAIELARNRRGLNDCHCQNKKENVGDLQDMAAEESGEKDIVKEEVVDLANLDRKEEIKNKNELDKCKEECVENNEKSVES